MLTNVRGLVLSRKKVAESDVVISLFSKTEGKIRIYVNGARHPKSKYASSTQPFVEGDFSVYIKKDLSSLGDVTIYKAHLPIRENINRLFLGTYMLELIELSLEEGDISPSLYERVAGALTVLETTDDLKLLKVVYGLKIAEQLGYAPSLFACSSCGTDKSLVTALSSAFGGVLCENCVTSDATYTRVTLEHLKWINVALKSPFSTIQKYSVDDKILIEIDKWLDRFIGKHLIRRPLKSLEVLKQML